MRAHHPPQPHPCGPGVALIERPPAAVTAERPPCTPNIAHPSLHPCSLRADVTTRLVSTARAAEGHLGLPALGASLFRVLRAPPDEVMAHNGRPAPLPFAVVKLHSRVMHRGREIAALISDRPEVAHVSRNGAMKPFVACGPHAMARCTLPRTPCCDINNQLSARWPVVRGRGRGVERDACAPDCPRRASSRALATPLITPASIPLFNGPPSLPRHPDALPQATRRASANGRATARSTGASARKASFGPRSSTRPPGA